MERKYRITAILFLSILFWAPSIATDESPVSSPADSPLNASLLDTTRGEWSRIPYHEPASMVTLLRLEANGTTFPGPRSMAFGPRRIEFSANPAALLLLTACVCFVVLACITYWRKKAALDREESIRDMQEDE